MATKKTTPATMPASMVDSKGNRRIYVDLPASLIVRFNVLAAMKGVTKRALLTTLLSDAISRAAAEAKL